MTSTPESPRSHTRRRQKSGRGASPGESHVSSPEQHSNRQRLTHIVSLEQGPSPGERLALFLIRSLRRAIPTLLVAAGDLAALMGSLALGRWLCHFVVSAPGSVISFANIAVFSAVAIGFFFAVGLYPRISLSGPEELRRLTLTTSFLATVLGALTYTLHRHIDASTSAYLLAWGVALILLPLTRSLLRQAIRRRRWWGHPAIIVAHDVPTARRLLNAFNTRPRLDIRPTAILTTRPESGDGETLGLPQVGGPGPALAQAHARGVEYAILAAEDLADSDGAEMIRRYETLFRHWIIIPSITQTYSLWVSARDLSGLLGLEITNNLLKRTDKLVKRCLDLALTAVLIVVGLPLALVIALLIKCDSKGPIIYRHCRIGKDGRQIRIFKFRTMHSGAAARLERYLESHPHLREEWNRKHKLKDDPRVTRIGRWLRRSSLDELPQLINVLAGDMSLVGPRPIVTEEIAKYGDAYDIYKRLRPGITGLWQVSGRSNTGYEERIGYDIYYARNWSIWLDVYLLAKTVTAVFASEGAF